VRAERPRIAPTWLVLLLAVVVILTMLASSPRGGLQQRLASVGEPSDLSAAYLEAWSSRRTRNSSRCWARSMRRSAGSTTPSA
jgi:hypothetical protein